jgi:O-antigen ligase
VRDAVERIAFTLYLMVLALSPLLFGAVHTYAYTIAFLGVLIGGLLLVIGDVGRDATTGVYVLRLPNTRLYVAFIAIVAFLVFQGLPLPDSLVGILSPESKVMGAKSLPASISGATVGRWFTLTPYWYPVRMSIIRFVAYGLLFLGLAQVLNSRKRIEVTVSLILIVACFEALYGLAQTFTGSPHIWWFTKPDPQSVSGTYINRNHFAGLMELCLVAAASYAAALSGQRGAQGAIPGHRSSLRARISRYLSVEQRFTKRVLIVFAGAIISLGLVFSGSRGGIISAAGAMLCMSLFLVFRKHHRQKGFIILSVFLIASVYALHIGVEFPLGRFQSFHVGIQDRARYGQRTLDLFRDYRVAGVGVGNFPHAFPRYQAPEHKGVLIQYAHNDWAQFLAEAGIVGLSLLLAGLALLIYRTIRLWRNRSNPFALCLGLAPLAAITAMAIHSCSEFNLHIPANCLVLAAIMAIGYSALHLERHGGRDRTLSRYRVMPLRYKGMVVLALALGLVIWSGLWTIRHFMAETWCNTVTNSTLNRDQDPPLQEIRKAITWDGRNAEYWHKLAGNLMRLRDKEWARGDHDQRHARQVQIVRALELAVRLNPLSAEYHQALGWNYTYLWPDPDHRTRWLPAADISMDRAAYCAGDRNPYLYVSMGDYWVMRSKTVHPAGLEWWTAWSKACWHYRKAQYLEGGRQLAARIASHVWSYYPDEGFVAQALREEHRVLLRDLQ